MALACIQRVRSNWAAVCDASGAFFVLVGVVATGVNSYYLHRNTAAGVWPAFLGLWFSLFIAVFSLQLVLRPRLGVAARPTNRKIPVYFYSFLATVSLIIGILYFVAFRLDGGLYGFVLAGILSANAGMAYFLTASDGTSAQGAYKPLTAVTVNADGAADADSLDEVDGKVPRQGLRWCPPCTTMCTARTINLIVVCLSAFLLVMLLGGAGLQVMGSGSGSDSAARSGNRPPTASAGTRLPHVPPAWPVRAHIVPHRRDAPRARVVHGAGRKQ